MVFGFTEASNTILQVTEARPSRLLERERTRGLPTTGFVFLLCLDRLQSVSARGPEESGMRHNPLFRGGVFGSSTETEFSLA